VLRQREPLAGGGDRHLVAGGDAGHLGGGEVDEHVRVLADDVPHRPGRWP